MASLQRIVRVPKKGEPVGIQGHYGIFEVITVNKRKRSVLARLTSVKPIADHLVTAPWTMLAFPEVENRK